jgi:TIR domain
VPRIRTVAMPLVATGDYRLPVALMIEPLLDAAVHWMALGFPLERLKIVANTEAMARDLDLEFAALKGKFAAFSLPASAVTYEVFVSYSHDDTDVASRVVDELRRRVPGVRVFFDRMTLDPGAAWQQAIYEAIDASAHILPMLSPSYLGSKVCLEEFNIALHRRRDTGQEILFPMYVYSAPLPSYVRALVNYEDCREADPEKLRLACGRLGALL